MNTAQKTEAIINYIAAKADKRARLVDIKGRRVERSWGVGLAKRDQRAMGIDYPSAVSPERRELIVSTLRARGYKVEEVVLFSKNLGTPRFGGLKVEAPPVRLSRRARIDAHLSRPTATLTPRCAVATLTPRCAVTASFPARRARISAKCESYEDAREMFRRYARIAARIASRLPAALARSSEISPYPGPAKWNHARENMRAAAQVMQSLNARPTATNGD